MTITGIMVVKKKTKKINNTQKKYYYWEKNEYGQLANCLISIYCISKRGKEEFGRSFKWWGRSFQRSTAIDWIDCFPIFVLVRRLSEFFIGHMVYYKFIIMYLIGKLKIILKNAWQLFSVPLLYYRAVHDKWCLFKLPPVENRWDT